MDVQKYQDLQKEPRHAKLVGVDGVVLVAGELKVTKLRENGREVGAIFTPLQFLSSQTDLTIARINIDSFGEFKVTNFYSCNACFQKAHIHVVIAEI